MLYNEQSADEEKAVQKFFDGHHEDLVQVNTELRMIRSRLEEMNGRFHGVPRSELEKADGDASGMVYCIQEQVQLQKDTLSEIHEVISELEKL